MKLCCLIDVIYLKRTLLWSDMWSSHFPETYLIYTLVNDTQPRWNSAHSAGAGNDRNERYPSFPTIALPLELEQAIFAGFGRFRLCMEGINLGIWEARKQLTLARW